jgi:hypothetical protein
MIRSEDQKISSKNHKNEGLSLSCYDSKTLTESTVFVMSCGGFSSEKKAFDQGVKIKKALLMSGPVLRIGLDVGNDRSSSSISTGLKQSVFKKTGVKIIEDVHGLSVYSEDYPTQVMSISGSGVTQPWTAEEFLNAILDINSKLRDLTEKESLCLELFSASHFEKSERARFITLVLAIESLLEPIKRRKEVAELVGSFLELTNESSLLSQEKASIKGSLQWLYINSISQSLKELALNYLPNKEYNGLPSQKFISKCYDIRASCKMTSE